MNTLYKIWIIIPFLLIAIKADENDSLRETELMLFVSKIQDEFNHVRGEATFSFDIDDKGNISNVKNIKAQISPPYEINEILRYINKMKFSFLSSQVKTITINFIGSRNLKSGEKVFKPILISLLCAGATALKIPYHLHPFIIHLIIYFIRSTMDTLRPERPPGNKPGHSEYFYGCRNRQGALCKGE